MPALGTLSLPRHANRLVSVFFNNVLEHKTLLTNIFANGRHSFKILQFGILGNIAILTCLDIFTLKLHVLYNKFKLIESFQNHVMLFYDLI